MKFKKVISMGLVLCALAGGMLSAQAEDIVVEDNSAVYAEEQSENFSKIYVDGTYDYTKAHRLFTVINEKRKAAGLSGLELDEDLNIDAMKRAAECSLLYSHKRPNGKSYISVIESGYGVVAESISAKQTKAEDVAGSWSKRKGDSGNMLNEDFTAVGIGCFYQPDGNVFWTAIYTDQLSRKAEHIKNITSSVEIEADSSHIGSAYLAAPKTKLIPGEVTKSALYIVNTGLSKPDTAESLCFPNVGTIEFSSSNAGVASVTESGVISAKKDGTAVITAKIADTDISAAFKITVKIPYGQRVPQNVTVSNRSDGIKVTWDEVNSSKFYIVLRSRSGKPYTAIKEVTKPYYTDKNVQSGILYRYKIVGSTGKTRTRESSYKNMYRLNTMTVNSLSVTGQNSIKARWTSSSDADGYQIEYVNKKNGAGSVAVVDDGARKSLTIKGLEAGQEYSVRIRSYKNRGTKTYYSGWGAKKTAKTAENTVQE